MTLVYTTNQLLFATTFSCDLPKMNWIKGINFHDKALSTPFFFFITTVWQILVHGEKYMTVFASCNNEALVNLAKFLAHK